MVFNFRFRKGLLRHAIKTGLAAALTELLVSWLNLPQGYWAVISAVFVMQSNLGGALMAGWSRLVGTASGAFFGALGASLFGLNWFSLAVAVAASVAVCTATPFLRESARIATITAGIVILAAGEASPWLVALMRFCEIGLGIAIALAVSLAWPSRAERPLRHGLSQALSLASQLLGAALDSLFGQDVTAERIREQIKALAARVAANASLCDETRAESRNSQQSEKLFEVHRIERRLLDHTADLAHLAEDPVPQGFHENVKTELRGLEREIRLCLDGFAQTLLIGAAVPDLTDLNASVARVEVHMTSLRKQRALAQYELSELARFFSLLHGLLAVAEEMAELDAVLAEPGVKAGS